jgi:Domain of unknown function (DUF4404)
MDQRELFETLSKLHSELSQSDQVDPAAVEMLRTLTADMNRLLGRQGVEAPVPEDVEPVARGLKDLMLRFEADYPQLSSAVGKVADALAGMGI